MFTALMVLGLLDWIFSVLGFMLAQSVTAQICALITGVSGSVLVAGACIVRAIERASGRVKPTDYEAAGG